MRKIQLNKREEKDLGQRLKTERDAKIFKRLQAIKLKNQGIKNFEIAKIIGVRPETITVWFKLFVSGGFNRLTTLNYLGTTSKLEPFKDKIKKIIIDENISKLADLQDKVESEFEVKVEFSWFFRWCKKNYLYPLKKLV